MLLRESPAARRCCVTSLGKISSDWRLWFLCWNAEGAPGPLVLSCYSFYEVLNYLRWCLQPDGKAMVQRDQ